MSGQTTTRWGRFVRAPLLSPSGMLLRAMLIAVCFAIAHAAGLREYTSILSGTSASGAGPDIWSAALGVTYVALYFGFVLVVPIAVLGSAILAVLLRLTNRGSPDPAPESDRRCAR